MPGADAERLILQSAEVKDLEEPPDELLSSLLRRVAQRRAVRRWRGLAAAAAAVVIAIAGGAAGARIIAPGANPAGHAQASPVTEEVSATNPRTNVSAVVRYISRSWGTRMDVWVNGIKDGTICQIWAVNASGQRWSAGSWTVASGHGGSDYPASVSLGASQLRSFQITSGGRVLVTVPAT